MKSLYDVIRRLPTRSPEPLWFHDQDLIAETMEKFRVPTDGSIVEVGSWMGDSAAWFASKVPSGTVYCVDTWRGPIDVGENHSILSNLYQQFLSNIANRGLTERILPVRMKSVEAAMCLDVQADMVFLDADHSAVGCYEDILLWAPKVKPGGLLCGDDMNMHTVEDAVTMASRTLGRQVLRGEHFWWFADTAPIRGEVV